MFNAIQFVFLLTTLLLAMLDILTLSTIAGLSFDNQTLNWKQIMKKKKVYLFSMHLLLGSFATLHCLTVPHAMTVQLLQQQKQLSDAWYPILKWFSLLSLWWANVRGIHSVSVSGDKLINLNFNFQHIKHGPHFLHRCVRNISCVPAYT